MENTAIKSKGEKIISEVNSSRWDLGTDFHDSIVESIYADASRIAKKTVKQTGETEAYSFDLKVDKIVTSRWLGFPIMFLILTIVFWLTIAGANYPSGLLASFLIDTVHPFLKNVAASIHLPWWLDGVLIDGAYLAMAWVIAVMLPPMAIFFPIFTLLEDLGYLPRVAFNMDNLFRKAGAHGKQALTMSMGFGCNAAGVVAARVIDSPRERLIAIITNNFSLCNGRWPTQILIATIFIGSLVPAQIAGIVSAGAVVTIALLGIFFSLVVSWGLSKSVLKGEASSFSLELPPYRPPRILQTLYTSLIDRTIIVLWRAIVFAIPAGVIIWLAILHPAGIYQVDDLPALPIVEQLEGIHATMVELPLQVEHIGCPCVGHIPIRLYPVIEQLFPNLECVWQVGHGGQESLYGLRLQGGRTRGVSADTLHVDFPSQYGPHQSGIPFMKTLKEPLDGCLDFGFGGGLACDGDSTQQAEQKAQGAHGSRVLYD